MSPEIFIATYSTTHNQHKKREPTTLWKPYLTYSCSYMLSTSSKLYNRVYHSQERDGAGSHRLICTRVTVLQYFMLWAIKISSICLATPSLEILPYIQYSIFTLPKHWTKSSMQWRNWNTASDMLYIWIHFMNPQYKALCHSVYK
jgi:hypothetical protein